jgi:hypothetical protein
METTLKELLKETRFDFVSGADKEFMVGLDDELARLGYDFGGKIGDGYCWGRYMLIYRKTGAKSQNVYARVYLREQGVALRLFLNDIDRHRPFIEQAPRHVKDAFTDEFGRCEHCHNEKDGKCRFRKAYTIDGSFIEKCNGYTFEFRAPAVSRLPDYLSLFAEFNPVKKSLG